MTNIEAKALALVNDCGGKHTYLKREWNPRYEALCRAIEQHEAFRQEVSDAMKEYCKGHGIPNYDHFIIPAPKPDPLVEVLAEVDIGNGWDDETDYARQIHKALAARGLEIRSKNDD